MQSITGKGLSIHWTQHKLQNQNVKLLWMFSVINYRKAFTKKKNIRKLSFPKLYSILFFERQLHLIKGGYTSIVSTNTLLARASAVILSLREIKLKEETKR